MIKKAEHYHAAVSHDSDATVGGCMMEGKAEMATAICLYVECIYTHTLSQQKLMEPPLTRGYTGWR